MNVETSRTSWARAVAGYDDDFHLQRTPGRKRMSDKYDETLRHHLIEAFGDAVNDLTPCGGREVVHAAIHCLIIAMIQYLGSLSPNIAAEVINPFAQKIYRAAEVAMALHAGKAGTA